MHQDRSHPENGIVLHCRTGGCEGSVMRVCIKDVLPRSRVNDLSKCIRKKKRALLGWMARRVGTPLKSDAGISVLLQNKRVEIE